MAQYAILVIAPDGSLADIVEKPDPATLASFGSRYFVSMNCWRFDASIFDAGARISPSARGELELPNAVRYAVRTMHQRFQTVPLEVAILDLSRRGDIAEVERRLAFDRSQTRGSRPQTCRWFQGASERGERATRPERAGGAARESACRGVRGAKPLG